MSSLTSNTTEAPLEQSGADVDPPSRPRSDGARRRSIQGRSGFWFVLPFAVAFAIFLIWPIVTGLWMSFTNQSLTGSGSDFAGLANYSEAVQDGALWQALGNTAFFTLLTVVPLVVLSFALAYLVYIGLPGQWLWRLSFFAPYLLPVSVTVALWQWMFQPDFGLLNGLLQRAGLAQLGFISEEGLAMFSVALVTVWWTIGFNFLLYLSALNNIPDHLYEAASIDGAGPWRRLVSITIPMISRTTVMIVMLQILASLKVFEQIFLLTNGGPNGSTRSVLEYIYDVGFTGYRLGYASAISYLFFALIVVISIVQLRVMNRKSA
ncbi:sugar ABC transporter permease [Arthrobacter sp. MN05-02]|nr:sugar ABC transporter permease [Arthrobacter sp. MN05-02]